MQKTNNKKVITLVALVITIIILLIVAAISIQALTGSRLFGKSQQTKQETENATLNGYKNNRQGGHLFTNVNTSETNPEGAMLKGATVIEGDANKGIVI